MRVYVLSFTASHIAYVPFFFFSSSFIFWSTLFATCFLFPFCGLCCICMDSRSLVNLPNLFFFFKVFTVAYTFFFFFYKLSVFSGILIHFLGWKLSLVTVPVVTIQHGTCPSCSINQPVTTPHCILILKLINVERWERVHHMLTR